MEQKIRLIVKEAKTKEGKTFPIFSTFDKENRRYKVKFTKEVKNVPDENCMLVFDSTDANISEDAYGPVLWISKITGTEKFERIDKVADTF